MPTLDPVFLIAVLIISVVLHEVSHGYAADLLGDHTARLAGRLTLNPLVHLDWLGSVIVPLVLSLLPGGLVFGWAKPVPYNPYNLRAGRAGPALVAIAGPAANLLIAVIFSFSLRFGLMPPSAFSFVGLLVLVNLMLAVFNLMPIPPLDGSKILFAVLPNRLAGAEEWWRAHQLWIFLAFILLLTQTNFLGAIVFGLFRLIMGM